MRTLGQLVGILLVIGFVGAYFWWILTVLALAGLVYGAVRAFREIDELEAADRAADAEVVARADQQHAWVLAGDYRGTYGHYPTRDHLTDRVLSAAEPALLIEGLTIKSGMAPSCRRCLYKTSAPPLGWSPGQPTPHVDVPYVDALSRWPRTSLRSSPSATGASHRLR